jgi:uncharacterized protein (DUF934 family)
MPDGVQLIRDGDIVESTWQHVSEDTESLPGGDVTVALAYWMDNKQALLERSGRVGVRVEAGDDPMELSKDLDQLPLIVLEIEALVDGRSYSHAYLLRQRLGYAGEIRAIGDVYRDQINFLARCGVNAFELSEGDDIEDALKAFRDYSVVYQPSADDEELIFARRRFV